MTDDVREGTQRNSILSSTVGREPLGSMWAHRTIIAAILVMITILFVLEPEWVWNPPGLLPALNVIFLSTMSLIVTAVAARSYLHDRSMAVLLLGCGTLALGLGTLVANLPTPGADPNIMVSTYNTAALAAGILHLGSVLVITLPSIRPSERGAPAILALFASISSLMIVVAALVHAHQWPVYFVPGSGPTTIGLLVLLVTILSFALSAFLLSMPSVSGRRAFHRLYALGLGLIASGLLAVALQTNIGDALNWLGRSAQYLGTVLMLAAVIVSARRNGNWLLPLERALRESEDRYHGLVTLSPDAIMVHADDHILFANPAALDLTGASSWATLEGRSFVELFPDDQRIAVTELFSRLRESSSVGPWESRLLRLDGGTVDIEITVSLTQVEERPAIQTFIRNVTARKIGERQMEAMAEFLYLINQSARTQELVSAATAFFQEMSGCEAVGIRLKDGDDFPYFETRGFPPHFVTMERSLCNPDQEGRTVRDATGNPVLECMCGNVIQGRFDPEKPFFTANGSFWTNSTSQLLSTTSETDRQVRTRNRCNGEGYESVALIPLKLGSKGIGLIQLNDRRPGQFTIDMISQWERLAGYMAVALARFTSEDELASYAKRLERSNEELQQFAYIASHDLQEPLRMVLTYVALLNKKYGDALPEPSKEYLMYITEGAGRMRQLVSDLLEYSRIDSTASSPVPVDLGVVVRQTESCLRISLEEIGAVINAEPLPTIQGDPGQMGQVFMNLISNAIKFRRGVPPVITIRSEEDSLVWRISVKDNGIGIDPRYHANLFKMFYRLHTRDEYPGSGIGLAIAKKIVERHGGRIWVESEPGEGSTFYFTISKAGPTDPRPGKEAA